jgi:hypothetical protein
MRVMRRSFMAAAVVCMVASTLLATLAVAL